jgi:hypothetical protein
MVLSVTVCWESEYVGKTDEAHSGTVMVVMTRDGCKHIKLNLHQLLPGLVKVVKPDKNASVNEHTRKKITFCKYS